MNVGDLVKFKEVYAGMEGLTGIVVGWNGEAVMVHWISRGGLHAKRSEFCDHLQVLSDTEVISG